jgi:uncharacterized protein YlaN (UPF0358 family)
MANVNSAAGLSLKQVRASVRRLQNEGERLFDRVRDDARKLAARAPRPELPPAVVDARDRAQATLRREAERVLDEIRARTEPLTREISARREQLLTTVQEGARSLADRATKALGLAEVERMSELSREVTGLSLRVAELERKLANLSKKLKQQEAA